MHFHSAISGDNENLMDTVCIGIDTWVLGSDAESLVGWNGTEFRVCRQRHMPRSGSSICWRMMRRCQRVRMGPKAGERRTQCWQRLRDTYC